MDWDSVEYWLICAWKAGRYSGIAEGYKSTPRVVTPQPHDRHCLTPGHALSCLCFTCAPDLKYDDGTPVPEVLRIVTFNTAPPVHLLPDDTFDPYDTKRRP